MTKSLFLRVDYISSIVTVTTCHKFSGLEGCRFILKLKNNYKTRGQKKVVLAQEWPLSRGSMGESISSLFQLLQTSCIPRLMACHNAIIKARDDRSISCHITLTFTLFYPSSQFKAPSWLRWATYITQDSLLVLRSAD